MTDIPLVLPTAALEQINKWADMSGLTRAKFYSTALIMGGRAMNLSVSADFLGDLTPEERTYMSASANNSATPEVLLQIVLESGAQANASHPEQTTTELVMSLPDDMFKQCNEAADRIGMAHEKFYSLAFVTGARLIASTLDNSSIFPLELVVQFTQGDVTPEMLM
jgi:hypothetical protein